MFRGLIVVVLILGGIVTVLAQQHDAPLHPCEWCGGFEAPDELTSTMVIAADGESGERLVVRGVLVDRDGHPLGGVLLYAYHTDNTGMYRKEGNETGNGRRHGVLRGWLLTDPDGSFEIQTIKPGGYPGRPDPAHIHITVTIPGEEEIPVQSLMFEGDPRITQEELEKIDDLPGEFWPILSPDVMLDGMLLAECRVLAQSTLD